MKYPRIVEMSDTQSGSEKVEREEPKKLPPYEAGVVEALKELIRKIEAGEIFDREPTSRDIGDE